MKPFVIVILPAIAALFLWAAMAFAQSSNILIPYGMSAGMSVLNRAMQPCPAAASTPAPDAGYGSNRCAAVGVRTMDGKPLGRD
jgi:hypothetical protein